MAAATGTWPAPLATVLLAVLLAAAVGGGVWWQRRCRLARSIPARLARASEALLADVLIPDADAGQLHVGFLARTGQGIVVVEVRDVAGHVFGSEPMQEWTVLGPRQRLTFANPLPALYDRVAAVKRLLPDVPVRGVVAFTPRAQFTKGVPPHVAPFDALVVDLQAECAAADPALRQALDLAWTRLADAVQPRRPAARG